MTASIALVSLYPCLVGIYYQMNKAYIAQHLCKNNEIYPPKALLCSGRCYLDNLLSIASNDRPENQQIPIKQTSINHNQEIQLALPVVIIPLKKAISGLLLSALKTQYLESYHAYSFEFYSLIWTPPK